MAEQTAEEKALANSGATPDNLNQGQTTAGAPKPPEVPNTPPSKEDTPADKKDTPSTEQQTEQEEKKKEPEPEIKEYIQLDDPAGQAAIDLLKEAGVTPNEANGIFAKAIESGNLADIDVKTLEAKVGKTKATLIMAGVTEYYNTQKQRNEAAVKNIYEVFGGEDKFAIVREWAQTKEKVDPEFKKQLDEIRQDLNRGGRAARAAAQDLKSLFTGDPNTKGLGTDTLIKGDKSPADVGAALTRQQYVAELKKAHDRGASPSEIAQLDARRKAGMKAGI